MFRFQAIKLSDRKTRVMSDITELFGKLKETKYFSLIHLGNVFFQVELEKRKNSIFNKDMLILLLMECNLEFLHNQVPSQNLCEKKNLIQKTMD